jgi:L-threonylcarbamoyladenylate synthase
VIRTVGPLAVSSANRAGDPAATSAADAAASLGDAVACYLDDGARATDEPSTVLDLTRHEPVILRSGSLPDDEVLAVARGEIDPFQVGEAAPGGDG